MNSELYKLRTIRQALNFGFGKLKSASESPALDAEVFLSFVLKKPKEYFFTYPEKRLSKKVISKYILLLNRRAKGMPVAYLTDHKEFYGLDFLVTEDVLIPRPETENLVELVLERISRTCFARPRKTCSLKILDVGTGSGCIIISLAKTLYNLSPITYPLFFASDTSKKALAVARKNARRHNVKITFKQGDLLKPWRDQKFDIIIANLPYLWKLGHPSTRFEPRSALVAGNHGLALYKMLFEQIRTFVKIRNFVAVEFDPRQTKQIKKLAKKYLPAYGTKIHKDLSLNNRFLELINREAA